MNKKELQEVYDYLSGISREYQLASRTEKSAIERDTRLYAGNLNPEIYYRLNDNAASGLFKTGFFSTDLSNSLRTLKRLLDEKE